MAALARITWADMKTEVLRRLGRTGDTATGLRVERWVNGIYRLLCAIWHQPELDKISSPLTLAVGASSVTLPTDFYLPVGARLLSDASVFLAWLQPRHARVLLGKDRSKTQRPAFYCRHGSNLYVDSKADVAYKVELFYYAIPPAPDFASGSPASAEVFDELILEGATALGQMGLWRPDLAAANHETMESYLARMAHPMLASGTTSDEREEPTDRAKLAGALG
jgi:hypothetical protein